MRTSEGVEAAIVDEQMHITHSERCCILIICIGIFAWTEEKEEAKDQHICYGG
jgi:hypothetical protein